MRSWLATARRSRGRRRRRAPPGRAAPHPHGGGGRANRPRGDPGRAARADGAARHHQRTADGGDGRVGRLFGSGQLIVAEVLVSAEVMQAAVDRLKPHLKGAQSASRARSCSPPCAATSTTSARTSWGFILGTNGYHVVDLGVQCSLRQAHCAWRERRTDSHRPLRPPGPFGAPDGRDCGGPARRGVDVPLLVGGAALSASFTRDRIAPAYGATVHYASDAMAGLAIANELIKDAATAPAEAGLAPARALHSLPLAGEGQSEDPARPRLPSPQAGRNRRRAAARPPLHQASLPTDPGPSTTDHDLPRPPDLMRHVLRQLPLDEVLRAREPQMLFGRHLGVRGSVPATARGGR